MIKSTTTNADLVQDPNDHLGIIYLQSQRMRRIYPHLEFNEILSEMYLILFRCCQNYNENNPEGANFSTYTHASCKTAWPTIELRIRVGKRSPMRMAMNDSMVSLESGIVPVDDGEAAIASVDNIDEVENLLDECTPKEIEAVIDNIGHKETLSDIGFRYGFTRGASVKWRNRAIEKMRLKGGVE